MKRRKPNFRFIAIFFASVAILCTSTYFVHGYQVRRNAGALLQQAESAQKADQLQEASNYLGQYVGMLPKDAEGLARYGMLLANPRMMKTPRDAMRAKLILERALYLEPNRDDVRRSAIKIALDMGDSTGAREDIQRLLKKSPNDGELKGMLARSHEQGGRFSDARSAYEEAIKQAPELVDNYVRYAALLRQRTKDVQREKESVADVYKRADEVTNAMVAAIPKSHQAYLYRAEYLQQFSANNPKAAEQAASDIAKARELSPDEPEVLTAAANQARLRGNLDEARQLLRRGCELHPNDFRLYLSAARLEELDNKPDAAIATLRQGLGKIPNNFDLLWQLADLLTREGKAADSVDALRRLKALGVPDANCDVFQSRLLAKDQNWSDAAAMLEKAFSSLLGRKNSATDPLTTQLALQAGVALGRCYEQMGDFDRAFAAYNRVVARDPRSIAGNLGLAMTLNAMGRPTEALERYRQLMLLPGAPGMALVEIARLTFFRTLAQDEGRRNWAEVNKAIRDAEEMLTPVPVQVVVLRADALAAQGQVEAARQHLLDKYPDAKERPTDAWIGLAMLEARQNRLEAALALLDEARQIHKDAVDLRLVSARLMVRKSPKDVAAILNQLQAGTDQWKPDVRRQLLNGLAEFAVQAGETTAANQIWNQLAKDAPSDLRYQLVLFDLAARNNDEAAMTQAIAKMKKIEGDGGVMWRFATAAQLVGKAARGDRSGLPEARALLLDVAKRRPNWSRAELCQAQLDDLEGKSDEALAGYQRQIVRGEREPMLIRRAVELLYQKRRYTEAYELFRLLPNPETLSHDVNRLGSAVALSTNNAEAALNLAKAAVANGSKDFRDHLWLGRVYLASNQKEQAQAAFEEARKLAPTEPETWVTLIQFLAAAGAKDRALVELEAAKKQLTGPEAAIAFAICHEALGQTELARDAYKSALTANPDDPTVLRAVAEYHFRSGQMAEAVPHLRCLSNDFKDKNPTTAGWARQTLALALALQGDPRNTREALQLLVEEEKAAPRGSDLSNVDRTRATILAMQGTKKSRQDAVQILKEKLIDTKKALPADNFLAAQLYDSLDMWPDARLRYVTLLEMPGGNTPTYKIAYCRSLLRRGAADLARPIISELEAQDAKAWPVQELHARLLHAQGKTAEAIKHLEAVAQDESRVALVAGLLNDLKAFDAAETLFRRLAEKPDQPINSLTLAQFLASRQRFAEAIDICDRVWSKVPTVAVAEVATSILNELPPTSREFDRVERRLVESMKADPDNADLNVAMANLRNFQGRYDDAEKLYRAALAKNPRQGTALNNLAWIIALRGGRSGEAIELITRALDLIGPETGLLDTRGVAYLSHNQPQYHALALKDLETVAAESPSASSYFHLAQAYFANGRRDEAKLAWQKAKKEFQLSANALHPLERPTFEKMARELN